MSNGNDLGRTRAKAADCLVLGAGVAGMTAARDLSEAGRSVLVIEGSSRVGGRVRSIAWQGGLMVELGAELIHRPGDKPDMRPFWRDVRRYALATRKIHKKDFINERIHIYFDRWRFRRTGKLRTGTQAIGDAYFARGLSALEQVYRYRRRTDMAASDFIHWWLCEEMRADLDRGVTNEPMCDPDDEHKTAYDMADYILTGTVPGETDQLSIWGLKSDQLKAQEMSDEEFHVVSGYDQLPRAMQAGIEVVFDADVRAIDARHDRLKVTTADGTEYHGRTGICTFSIGRLKEGGARRVQFTPALPAKKIEALAQVDLGPESKVVIEFARRFWPAGASLLNSPGLRRRSFFVPLYGQSDLPVLTALITRSEATNLDSTMGGRHEVSSDDNDPAVNAYVEGILRDLSELAGLGQPLRRQQDVVRYRAVSWANDVFARGGTSYIRFTGAAPDVIRNVRKNLASADETKPLFWAGEATALTTQPWSVHGAHESGRRAAAEVDDYL